MRRERGAGAGSLAAWFGTWLVFALAAAFAPLAHAYDGIVEKQVFEMPAYTTVGGKTIKNLRVGYETYGKLNAAGENAILICHFFSASSHAARRIKARTILIPVKSDVLTFPEFSRTALEQLMSQRRPVDFFEIDEDGGVVDGIVSIGKAAETIRLFLED